LSQAKRRPALVLAALDGDDLILCQITSTTKFDNYAKPFEASDFEAGGLNQASRIRPNRLFTADSAIVLYAAGHVRAAKVSDAVSALARILELS